MNIFNFNSWNDILHENYVLTLFISVFVVIATLVISRKFNVQNMHGKNNDDVYSIDENKTEGESNIAELQNPNMKRSPALVAEKVIQANMTAEQKQLEYQVRQQQLEQIYELMQKQSDKFGKMSLSEVEEQMKLYQ